MGMLSPDETSEAEVQKKSIMKAFILNGFEEIVSRAWRTLELLKL